MSSIKKRKPQSKVKGRWGLVNGASVEEARAATTRDILGIGLVPILLTVLPNRAVAQDLSVAGSVPDGSYYSAPDRFRPTVYYIRDPAKIGAGWDTIPGRNYLLQCPTLNLVPSLMRPAEDIHATSSLCLLLSLSNNKEVPDEPLDATTPAGNTIKVMGTGV